MALQLLSCMSFFYAGAANPKIHTLSLHDALPISLRDADYASYRALLRSVGGPEIARREEITRNAATERSEEHTSELQSHVNLVCRLLLEKKKKTPARSVYCCLPLILSPSSSISYW